MVFDDIRYDQVPRPSSAAPPSNKERVSSFENRLASPLDRLAAVVADLVLIVPVMALVMAPFRRQALQAQLLGREDDWALALAVAGIGAALAWILYQTVFVAFFGGTPGKKVMGLKVISVWDDKNPRPMAAFLRAIFWCLELVALGIPWLAVFSNERRRSFHDRIGDTAVVAVRRKAVGPPSIPEMGISSGLTAAAVTVLSVVALASAMRMRPALQSANEAAEAMEDAGLLCRSIGEARTEWMAKGGGSPSRLQVSLSLYGAEAVDEECLKGEAELALWRNEEKPLAYLAKALAEAGDERIYDSYLDKVCELGEKSPECAVVQLLRYGGETDLEIDNAEDKAELADAENRIEELISALNTESPAYLRVWVIRHLMDRGQYLRAMDLIDEGSPERKLGYYFARERAKALWYLERKDEARLALRSSIDTFEPAQKVELASWFCANETAESGCADEGRRACSWIGAAVESDEEYLTDPYVAVAYVRGESCSGELTGKRLAELKDKLPGREAKLYVEALSYLKSLDREKALKLLRKLASGKESQGAFFIEANARLAEIAQSVDELKPVKSVWMKLEPGDGWRLLGRQLAERFNALHAWNETLEVGMRIVEADQFDRHTYKQMVIAAFRAGNQRMAMGFLENLARLDETPFENGETARDVLVESTVTERNPASLNGFDEVARELLSKRKDEP